MTLSFDSKKFIKSGLPLVDYMILLALQQDCYVGKELACHLKVTCRTVDSKRGRLMRDGFIEKDGKYFYLTDKSRNLIAA